MVAHYIIETRGAISSLVEITTGNAIKLGSHDECKAFAERHDLNLFTLEGVI